MSGLLTASALTAMPWATAAPAPAPDFDAFIALSAILVGRKDLDSRQARRLFDALVADDPSFPKAASLLLAQTGKDGTDLAQMQNALDQEKSPFAHVPRTIMTAWWLGVVGSGATARCLAYETALNADLVSDVLKPPTYAYGGYGSWAAPPRTSSASSGRGVGHG